MVAGTILKPVMVISCTRWPGAAGAAPWCLRGRRGAAPEFDPLFGGGTAGRGRSANGFGASPAWRAMEPSPRIHSTSSATRRRCTGVSRPVPRILRSASSAWTSGTSSAVLLQPSGVDEARLAVLAVRTLAEVPEPILSTALGPSDQNACVHWPCCRSVRRLHTIRRFQSPA